MPKKEFDLFKVGQDVFGAAFCPVVGLLCWFILKEQSNILGNTTATVALPVIPVIPVILLIPLIPVIPVIPLIAVIPVTCYYSNQHH